MFIKETNKIALNSNDKRIQSIDSIEKMHTE